MSNISLEKAWLSDCQGRNLKCPAPRCGTASLALSLTVWMTQEITIRESKPLRMTAEDLFDRTDGLLNGIRNIRACLPAAPYRTPATMGGGYTALARRS